MSRRRQFPLQVIRFPKHGQLRDAFRQPTDALPAAEKLPRDSRPTFDAPEKARAPRHCERAAPACLAPPTPPPARESFSRRYAVQRPPPTSTAPGAGARPTPPRARPSAPAPPSGTTPSRAPRACARCRFREQRAAGAAQTQTPGSENLLRGRRVCVPSTGHPCAGRSRTGRSRCGAGSATGAQSSPVGPHRRCPGPASGEGCRDAARASAAGSPC